MSSYSATVIQTGGSFGLRLPKKYIDEHKLRLGEKVIIGSPQTATRSNAKRIIALFQSLNTIHAFQSIPDPIAWQRQQRRDRKLPQ
jgi:hypothetical protein